MYKSPFFIGGINHSQMGCLLLFYQHYIFWVFFFLDGNPDYCSLIEGVQWCSVGEFHHTRADFELNQDIINLAVRLKPQLWFTLVGHLFIFLAFFGNVQSILQRLMLLAQCLTAFGIPPALWLLPGGGSVAWWGWGGWLDVAGWLWVANWC